MRSLMLTASNVSGELAGWAGHVIWHFGKRRRFAQRWIEKNPTAAVTASRRDGKMFANLRLYGSAVIAIRNGTRLVETKSKLCISTSGCGFSQARLNSRIAPHLEFVPAQTAFVTRGWPIQVC